MNNSGCVYEIRCLVNDKVYYGQTIDFKRRKWEHLYNLRLNKHKNNHLQEDFNTYSENNFEFKILVENLNRPERIYLETMFIQQNGGIESNNVYNYQDNITENVEMRNKVSEGQKGKIISQETIMKSKAKLTGRNLSEEHKLHIKQGCAKYIGENNPAKRLEVRQKISKAVEGENNGMYGKHHTAEAKERIRQSRLGKAPGNKGKSVSQETKQKISRSLRGIIPWNKGKSKYSLQFIECLRQEYKELKSYKAVQRLHPEICYDVIITLIKNGKTN